MRRLSGSNPFEGTKLILTAMKHKKVISCIGLIQSNGIKFISKCTFFLERNETEYYYMNRGVKCYIGYDPSLYNRRFKLQSEAGKWHIERQGFETVCADGKKDIWYDNEKNMIIKISKYGKKQFTNLI